MQERKRTDISTVATPARSHEGAPRLVPALTIVSHPVPQRAGERLLLEELASGQSVAVSRVGPDFLLPGGLQGVPLDDPFLSRKPLVFEPVPSGGVRLRGEKGGTRVLVEDTPLAGVREFSSEELAAGIPLVLADRVVLLLHLALTTQPPTAEEYGMVGYSAGASRVREDISHVADLKVPVLVRGETGTGKELVAQAIHQFSPRRAGPFVSINLGALPKELAAAELFGARKGAYTGAAQEREGFFRAAHGGTLFLDEVGEAPPEVQALLLRVLETGEIFPVGGHTPVSVDVRLITATDANLEERIRKQSFKAPLLHRLAGYEIRVPPLRERREDIGMLFFHFARQELIELGQAHRLEAVEPRAEPWLPASLAVRLVRCPWPGNIRQLRNVTRQIVIGSRRLATLQLSPQLERELEETTARAPMGAPVQGEHGEPPASPEPAVPRRKPSEVSDQELVAALRATSWDLKNAAERLGITRSSLYMLIERSPSLRTAAELSVDEITRCFQECGGDLDAMVQCLQVSKRGLQRRMKDLGLDVS
ncbi:MAG: sigma-54-dependent Fis family transcriptional regulator [Myxococcaceae bacterium]|nr:sigma-54-dependent Fis family transcriptional regulator [Myxococcaceae bacterium]